MKVRYTAESTAEMDMLIDNWTDIAARTRGLINDIAPVDYLAETVVVTASARMRRSADNALSATARIAESPGKRSEDDERKNGIAAGKDHKW